jgi:tripartite ATP-independent transporter DctM subunit
MRSEARARHAAVAEAILAALDRVTGLLAVLCLSGIVLDVLAGVISRYVFRSSFSWTQEVGQWLYIYLIFLGVTLAHRSGSHIAFQAFDTLLPKRVQLARLFVVDVVVAYTTIFLLFDGIELVQLIGGVSAVMNWPNWIKFAVIPTTAATGLVYLALRDMAEGPKPWAPPLAVALAGVLFALIDAGHVRVPIDSPSLAMLTAFCVTLLIGTPVAFAMLFSAAMALLVGKILPGPAVIQNMVNGSGQFLLLAIPLFITASHLMNIGRLSERLIGFARTLVGHLRGGLAQVNVVTSFLFGGISGSSGADAALNSKLIVPQMVRHGYSPAFSCAITSASAVLPNIIPPSIAMLVFAAISDTSVIKLFIAGIVPGLLMTVLLMVTVYAIAWRRGYESTSSRPTTAAIGRGLADALPVLGLAVLIVGGIRFGVVTPTEAGVIAVIYAFLLGKFIYRGYSWKEVYGQLVTTATEASTIGFLIGVASPFAFVLISERVPQIIVGWLFGGSVGPHGVLYLVVGIALVAGTFLDLTATMLILVPLVMPLVHQLGVDPVHFGIVLVIALMLGGLTPPVGILVFISASITRTPVNAVFREIWPFVVMLTLGLLLIVAVPGIALWLVEWIG